LQCLVLTWGILAPNSVKMKLRKVSTTDYN
jgi:hypothetical protein